MSSAQAAHALSLFCKSTLPARNSFGLLPQGYCERKTPKSYKSSVLSVLLLIYEDNFDKLWMCGLLSRNGDNCCVSSREH